VIGNSVETIGGAAFSFCDSLASVYYKGTPAEWNEISISYYNNENLTNATRYYYSSTQPTGTTYKYWHYDNDGNPTPW